MHRKLPLLGVVLAAGLFSIPAVFPAEHWAVFTDRRQNPLILEASIRPWALGFGMLTTLSELKEIVGYRVTSIEVAAKE